MKCILREGWKFGQKINWGYIWVVSEPEYFGRMPIRTELTVLPADESRLSIGWKVKNKIGKLIANRKI